MAIVSAISAFILLLGLIVFQLLLILGLPLGKFAWGGYHKILPINLRISSLIAILLYLLFAVAVLEKANIVSVLPSKSVSNVGIWIITIYLFFATLMNALSKSTYEKFTMTPISLLLACLFLFVAM